MVLVVELRVLSDLSGLMDICILPMCFVTGSVNMYLDRYIFVVRVNNVEDFCSMSFVCQTT